VARFSETLIERSGYAAGGFADVYDAYRPQPATAVLDLLQVVAQADRPRLVVDLGAGTGLSTRAWADRADSVIGVEANRSMLQRARTATEATNVRYVEAFADATTVPSGRADIVTSAQAFHWMDPGPVLAEAARVLRVGGIFAAYDYDVPPVVHPDVDDAFEALIGARRAARSRLGLEAGASTWQKESHADRIRESGHFRYTRELVCHGWDKADARRIVGLAESIGGPLALFQASAPELATAYARLTETADAVLGADVRPMVLCYRIRLGIV
jgi:SAM-dependent methyltransferase